MLLNEAFYKYIDEHKDDNTNVLRLQQKESEEFDILFAIDQIEARKKIKNKLPHWHQNIYLLFPSVISTEQASSEETAIYKSELLFHAGPGAFLRRNFRLFHIKWENGGGIIH